MKIHSKINLLLIFLVLLTGCSKVLSENAEREISSSELISWINKIRESVNNSYVEVGNIGGFSDYAELKRLETNIDISSSAWNLRTLNMLNHSLTLSEKEKVNIERVLRDSLKNISSQTPRLYDYWCIVSIYDGLKLEIPDELKDEIMNYINYNSDDNGFIKNNEGGFDEIDSTLISIRLKKLLNLPINIRVDYLKKQINRSLSGLDKDNNMISYTMILFELEDTILADEQLVKELKAHYSTILGNWDYVKNGDIDSLYVNKVISKKLNINYVIPNPIIKRLNRIINQQIEYNQYPDGSLTYELLYVLDEKYLENNKMPLIDYVVDMRNDKLLWHKPLLREPKLKDTHFALSLSSQIAYNITNKQAVAITKMYDKEMQSESLKFDDIPFLMSIYFWLEKETIFEPTEQFELSDYIEKIKSLSVEKEALILVDLYDIYKFHNISIDMNILEIAKDIQNKININKLKDINVDLKTMTGYILSYALDNNKNENYFSSILSKYKKKNGYSINSAASSGDIIGNYYTEYLLKDFVIFDNDTDIHKYRSSDGYSLYAIDKTFTNLYFTYMGYVLESANG